MEDYKRNQKYIGQGCLTNSKHENSHVKGVYPKVVIGGRGCYLYTKDGRSYVDYICGLGTNLFGYGNYEITNAVSKAMQSGTSHSFPTHLEGLAAEKLTEIFPWVEKFKFLCTGSEGCSAAVRMARAYTGRSQILSESYHGWHDQFTSLTPPAKGIPPQNGIATLKSIDEVTEDIAGVIVEAIVTDTSNARIEWLKNLREKCDKTGTVLIFDEVITGFRYLNHSVANNYRVFPDLMVLGKAIGSGIPMGGVVGRKDILDGQYFVSSTNAGSVAGLAAAITAVNLLTGVTEYKIDRLWEDGAYFMRKFNAITPDVQIEGYPSRGAFKGDLLKRSLLFQECCKSGVLFGPSWFFNFHHARETEHVLNIVEGCWARIERGEIELEGELPQSPFAQKMREKL